MPATQHDKTHGDLVIQYSDSASSAEGEARIAHGQHSYPERNRYKAGKKDLQLIPERVRQSVLLV